MAWVCGGAKCHVAPSASAAARSCRYLTASSLWTPPFIQVLKFDFSKVWFARHFQSRTRGAGHHVDCPPQSALLFTKRRQAASRVRKCAAAPPRRRARRQPIPAALNKRTRAAIESLAFCRQIVGIAGQNRHHAADRRVK